MDVNGHIVGTLRAWSDFLLKHSEQFFRVDVPEILQLSAKALHQAPLPNSVAKAQAMSRDEFFQIIPIVAAIVLAVFAPFGWLFSTNNAKRPESLKNSHWFTRVLLLRAMGCVYLAAFLTSAFQGRALFGEHGIFAVDFAHHHKPSPVFEYLERQGIPFGGKVIEVMSWVGVLLSLVQVIAPVTTVFVPLALWLIYLSFLNMGSIMSNYGWEWLTQEAGFLSLFLCPIFSRSPFPRDTPPPRLVIWLFKWLAFRLMIGAGMSKMGRGSSACWKELTCTETHYFTQPMPNPLAWGAHHAPHQFHSLEVALTFLEQLVLPFMILMPYRRVQIVAGALELFFQSMIVTTGNYAWINWIGSVPFLALFDDHTLAPLFSSAARHSAVAAAANADRVPKRAWLRNRRRLYRAVRSILYVGLACFIATRSVHPIKELFGEQPWLHTYDDYYLVNAQGVFGFINQKRVSVVLSYTHSDLPTPPPSSVDKNCVDDPGVLMRDQNGDGLTCTDLSQHCQDPTHGAHITARCPRSCGECDSMDTGFDLDVAEWKPLEFKNLPGDPKKAPWFNTPYHRRFDWEVWIHTTASMERLRGPPQVPPFIKTLINKVLAGDTDAVGLLHTDIIDIMSSEGAAPTAIRADFYTYEFSGPSDLFTNGTWWTRQTVPGARPYTFLRGQAGLREQDVMRGAPQRHWVLWFACGAAMATVVMLCRLLLGPKYSRASDGMRIDKLLTQYTSRGSTPSREGASVSIGSTGTGANAPQQTTSSSPTSADVAAMAATHLNPEVSPVVVIFGGAFAVGAFVLALAADYPSMHGAFANVAGPWYVLWTKAVGYPLTLTDPQVCYATIVVIGLLSLHVTVIPLYIGGTGNGARTNNKGGGKGARLSQQKTRARIPIGFTEIAFTLAYVCVCVAAALAAHFHKHAMFD